jgi:nicotinamide-nucleotide amidase
MAHELFELAEKLGNVLKNAALQVATAESCTGGWIAQCITEIPGSSTWFDRGFVTYSNKAKVQMLGVNPSTLDLYGAVSNETAEEMATGALTQSEADMSVAVTGIAGPDGGSVEKPVGTVFVAWAKKGHAIEVQKFLLTGDRRQIREQTVKIAINGLIHRSFL